MSRHTKLDQRYWRYIINKMGRQYAVTKFHNILNQAKGERKNELINIYIEVFRAAANR